MVIPESVHAYFDADQQNDPARLTAVFETNAVVHDEGLCHVGHAAIAAWWLAAKAKYHHVAQPIGATQAGDDVIVQARVRGDFPNSPVTLTFVFTLRHEKIAALSIG